MSSSAPAADLFLLFTAPLDGLGLRYLVTGSVASILYGEPRMTHDIDIVLELDARAARRLVEAFPEKQFYCPPVEVIAIEANRRQRGHFNLIHHQTGYKADVYLKGELPLHEWALEQRRSIDLPAGRLWVASPEYVILGKLQYFRDGGSDKHLRDIRGMLAVSGTEIDRDAIESWVERLRLDEEWKAVSDS